MDRIIAMIDMDAFFASVEQAEDSSLRGLPIAVGGNDRRSVVATCSYEARKFGVRSAMPSYQAKILCPDIKFVKPNFVKYRQYSDNVKDIFLEHTSIVEFVSIDEAYLDLTDVVDNFEDAKELMAHIRLKIKNRLNVTASCGIGVNKFIAKVASDFNKPDGMTCVPPEQTEKFLEELPISKYRGVGSATLEKMLENGISTGKELRERSYTELEKIFGEKRAKWFYDVCRGKDGRPVNVFKEPRKSLSVSKTYTKDVKSDRLAIWLLAELVVEISDLAKRKNVEGRTITVKIKYNDFSLSTRSRTIEYSTNDKMIMAREIAKTFRHNKLTKPVRLFGVIISNLEHNQDIGLW